MTAQCSLCHRTINGGYAVDLEANPTDEAIQLKAYDSLAAHMWLHISDNHPNQMEEGIMIQRRAAKMYAMNWVTFSDEKIEPLRRLWRNTLIIKLATTTQFEGDQAVEVAPSPPLPPPGT